MTAKIRGSGKVALQRGRWWQGNTDSTVKKERGASENETTKGPLRAQLTVRGTLIPLWCG